MNVVIIQEAQSQISNEERDLLCDWLTEKLGQMEFKVHSVNWLQSRWFWENSCWKSSYVGLVMTCRWFIDFIWVCGIEQVTNMIFISIISRWMSFQLLCLLILQVPKPQTHSETDAQTYVCNSRCPIVIIYIKIQIPVSFCLSSFTVKSNRCFSKYDIFLGTVYHYYWLYSYLGLEWITKVDTLEFWTF